MNMSEQNLFVVNHSTRAIFGVGTHAQSGSVLRGWGCKRALCVCDPVIWQLGIADRVGRSIEQENIEVVWFDQVASDPTSDLVDRVGTLGREAKVDCVVGIGGGSTLDTAKGANLLLSNPGTIADYIGVNRGKRPIEKKIPLLLMPTTAGTSAEITPVFVVTHSETKQKTGASNRGDTAIIDPTFALDLPAHVTAATGIDMLAHVTESLINPKPHWLSEAMDELVISLVFRNLPAAYDNGHDLHARTQLAYACMIAGYAFADKGTYLGHAVADRISNRFHYSHGVGCALGLPVALRYAIKAHPEKVRRISAAIGLNPDLPHGELAQSLLDAYRTLQRRIGLKSMKEMGLDQQFISFVASDLHHDVRFQNNPYAPNYSLAKEALFEEFSFG